MARRNQNSTAEPAWRTKWPRNGDLKTWLRAMIQKCDAIPDHATAADNAQLPIGQLAELGCVTEALRNVNRFLRRLPRQNVVATVRLAELGAKVCLDADDLARMEKYLAIATATEPYNTRKCDKGFSLNSVREFRADNGLLDPADAIDEKQRISARFWRARRQFKQAMAAGELAAAPVAAAEMETIAHEVAEEWLRRSYLRHAIYCHAELKDAQAVKRCVRELDKEERRAVLDPGMLVSLGMKAEAVARARQDLGQELKALRERGDPNIHFPAMSLRNSLILLVEQGEKEEASRWLRRALKEMPTWPVFEYGWITSAVYHSLAEAMALIDGPDAAAQLLKQAMTDAKAEKRGDSRRAAVAAALDLKANIAGLDDAIEDARKLRSPTQRRKKLGTLLAKAQRWNELREVLRQVESPEEAADVAWWIKFELPGGEAL